MINHVRTLLVNETPTPEHLLGDEHIPRTYVRRAEPEAVQRLFGVLYGPTPDRVLKNYRMAQLMPLIHGSELQAISDELDPRLSYWPPRGSSEPLDWSSTNVTWSAGAPDRWHVLGNRVSTGPLVNRWTVVQVTGTEVRVVRESQPASTQIITVSGGEYDIPLHGSGAVLRTPALAPGATAGIQLNIPPALSFPGLLAAIRDSLGQEDLTALWSGHPIRTRLQPIWQESQDLGLCLGSVLLSAATLMDAQEGT